MGKFSIQISSSLINQLTEDEVKSKRRTKRTAKTKLPQEPQISTDFGDQNAARVPSWPIQPPLPLTPPVSSINSELEAIQSVVRESERVLEKLRKQEENVLQEVTQKAKDLHEKEFKLPESKPLPCSAENDAWIACYKENRDDLMKCSYLVNKFADCARRARQAV